MDSFICGICAAVFHDIGEFLEHKKICIAVSLDTANHATEMMQQPSSVHATVLDAAGKSTTFIIINGDMDNKMSSFSEVDNVNQLHNPSSSSQRNIAKEIMSCGSGILIL